MTERLRIGRSLNALARCGSLLAALQSLTDAEVLWLLRQALVQVVKRQTRPSAA